ncbi:MAG: hypothetical protein QGF53_03235 [Alphaproteobacteria bacterium]|jgi:outer membrane protein TolC|nr:hypothetical protein [Alphaproteobacteria bacterium]
MERDRIWSGDRSSQGAETKVDAQTEHTASLTDEALLARIAKAEAERDDALREAERMRRSVEVMRKTLDEARAESESEIGRLRQALAITRKSMEDERDLAQRERKTLVDNLNAQQELLEAAREKANSRGGLLGGLFGGGNKRMALA